MAEVQVEKRINAPVEQVFASWNDEFGDVYKFNPNLCHSKLLDESPASSGQGAMRQCDMKDGKNWVRERVIEVQENKKIVITIYEGTMPLKTATAIMEFKAVGANQTVVRITMEFVPKMGIIGKLLVPMMKKKFKPMLQNLLDANAAYVENGTLVNEEKST